MGPPIGFLFGIIKERFNSIIEGLAGHGHLKHRIYRWHRLSQISVDYLKQERKP